MMRHSIKFIVGIGVCLNLSACAPAPVIATSTTAPTAGAAEIVSANVYGWDTREERSVDDVGYRNIVFLPQIGCTGAFVWKNIVLTAAHCISAMVSPPDADKVYKINGVYTVQLKRRGAEMAATFKIAQMWWGTLDTAHDPNRDWALLRVDHKSDNYFEYLADLPASSNDNFQLSLAGYSEDLRSADDQPLLTGVDNCRIRMHLENQVYHDCDATRGASGAPIWKVLNGKPTIVALGVAEQRDGASSSLKLSDSRWNSNRNIGINPRAFAAKITELRRAYPTGEIPQASTPLVRAPSGLDTNHTL